MSNEHDAASSRAEEREPARAPAFDPVPLDPGPAGASGPSPSPSAEPAAPLPQAPDRAETKPWRVEVLCGPISGIVYKGEKEAAIKVFEERCAKMRGGSVVIYDGLGVVVGQRAKASFRPVLDEDLRPEPINPDAAKLLAGASDDVEPRRDLPQKPATRSASDEGASSDLQKLDGSLLALRVAKAFVKKRRRQVLKMIIKEMEHPSADDLDDLVKVSLRLLRLS